MRHDETSEKKIRGVIFSNHRGFTTFCGRIIAFMVYLIRLSHWQFLSSMELVYIYMDMAMFLSGFSTFFHAFMHIKANRPALRGHEWISL